MVTLFIFVVTVNKLCLLRSFINVLLCTYTYYLVYRYIFQCHFILYHFCWYVLFFPRYYF